MIVQAPGGTSGSFHSARRRPPEPKRADPAREEPGRCLVPLRPGSAGDRDRRAASQRPRAAFLAHLGEQYADRRQRALVRRQHLADALEAYTVIADRPARTGTRRDARA